MYCKTGPDGQVQPQGQLLDASTFQLVYSYRLPKLSLRIIIVSISPTISNSFTIGCPVDTDELQVRPATWTALWSLW